MAAKKEQTLLNEFIREVAHAEGGKVQTPVAQIREIFKLVNRKTNGDFYKLVRQRQRHKREKVLK